MKDEWFLDDEDGATDFTACKTRKTFIKGCECNPRCTVCGYGPHSAIHGPHYGQPIGSKPWGHRFRPDDTSEAP